MAKIVSFSNQKGGVGKTTSCVNISAQIANKGKKVLMIDMDPQGNATSGLGIPKSKVDRTIYDVIIGKSSIKDAIIKTKFKNLSVVPSNINLAGAELELNELEEITDYLKILLQIFICINVYLARYAHGKGAFSFRRRRYTDAVRILLS